MTANINSSTRKAVYKRDGYRCALCDCSQYIQIHHAVERGDGGNSTEHNLITLCSTCHAQVHGIDVVEDGWTREDVQQAIVEYLADYYAPAWNPWRKGRAPWDKGR